MKPVSRAKVQERLDAEAGKFNDAHRGVHIFKPIWQVDDPHCNWTTGFEVRGSTLRLGDMWDALERVQAKHPLVDFGE
ncbi:hypothetical protein [Sphingosinicella rhizophila]|uniref:Uncharacterized protein n=1 Tax=Sphingosinicella rhizophila TaxID=3050082 RepID=A0ABU3Q566_9SPHN|nr:hypothetical protein [Sphingosinicella sp. GR2756]MDT9598551.1 hypothetical protein [Sphingosinicella sp. GR2756]